MNIASYQKDLDLCLEKYPLDFLNNNSLLITGVSGMTCSCLVDLLLRWNEKGGSVKLILTSRTEEKIKARFPQLDGSVKTLSWNVVEDLPLDEKVDYVIHGASPADPMSYSLYPVDTMLANLAGTQTLLNYSKNNGVKRFLFVSSVEMYGQMNAEGQDFAEDYCGTVDHSSSRACYPAAKRGAEVLCQSYISQYKVDAVIARPCHIFGPTMTDTDERAASSFLRKAAKQENIVMKSTGALERSHCYVLDVASALLFLLKSGQCGEAYNIADPAYQMTIAQFAGKAAEAGGKEIIFDLPTETEAKGYSTVARAVLSSKKIEALGWSALSKEESGCAIQKTVEILREKE